ncbi:Protein of unknown function [Pyronema omphalodes CBS 100304]|uniref:Uncharacterized protein n=1 Tax=Pyronema omphalodes (strain CBS 100304) TaxID=1076935 RepID=U4L7F3_PYROM|nr:Protein of unknown function [Pyronema omphalodes CBS 100304]
MTVSSPDVHLARQVRLHLVVVGYQSILAIDYSTVSGYQLTSSSLMITVPSPGPRRGLKSHLLSIGYQCICWLESYKTVPEASDPQAPRKLPKPPNGPPNASSEGPPNA